MTFNLEEYKAKVKTFVEKYSFNQYLEMASEKTKVDKEYLFVGALALLVLLVFVIFGTSLIIDVVGFVYPLYASLKAIESTDKEDDKQWLTYWIIFTLFKIVESIADVLISFIPFYFVFKIAFLVWCYHPSFNGATVIYDLLLKDHLVPLLGITVTGFSVEQALGATKTATVSFLEVTVENLALQEPTKKPVYVELCACAPKGRASSGIENTVFKTDTVEGVNIAFQSKIVLSPLEKSDGFLAVRVFEKVTFGDDVLIGERTDLQVSSFKASGGERLVCACGDAEVVLNAAYIEK